MRRAVAVAVATLLCAGCLGSALDSKREAPEVYRLDAPPLPDGGDSLAAALVVARPRAPASLDTDRIAVVEPEHGFDHYAGVRWSEPAPQMLQRVLVDALAADGHYATVVAAPARVPSEYLLDVELRQFEAVGAGEAGPTVRVRLQATLVDARRGVRVTSFVAGAESPASANRRDAVIAAFDDATRRTVEAVVAGLREGSKTPPAK
jgi:cholesterol transport system auxiliary component